MWVLWVRSYELLVVTGDRAAERERGRVAGIGGILVSGAGGIGCKAPCLSCCAVLCCAGRVPRQGKNTQHLCSFYLPLFLHRPVSSLHSVMEPFYGPNRERPSALCVVTGALFQTPTTITRGLSTSEIKAYIVAQYPWATEPSLASSNKKGPRPPTKGKGEDEAARMVHEGVQSGVKNQLLRTLQEGTAETQVFPAPKLLQLQPDPKWLSERAEACLGKKPHEDSADSSAGQNEGQAGSVVPANPSRGAPDELTQANGKKLSSVCLCDPLARSLPDDGHELICTLHTFVA